MEKDLSTFSFVPLYTLSICSIDNFTHIVLYRWSWWLGVKKIQKISVHGVAI